MKKFLLLILCSLFSIPAFSQSFYKGGFGSFNIGYQHVGISNFLHDANNTYNYNPSSILIGGGGMVFINSRLMVGGSAFGSPIFINTPSGIKTDGELMGGYGSFGVKIIEKNDWFIYPHIGIGGGQSNVTITNNTANALVYNTDYQLQPNQKSQFSFGGFGGSLGISFKKWLFKKDDKRKGYILGFDIGVFSLPYSYFWEYGSENSEMPIKEFNKPVLTSYFASLSFGFGGLKKTDFKQRFL